MSQKRYHAIHDFCQDLEMFIKRNMDEALHPTDIEDESWQAFRNYMVQSTESILKILRDKKK